MKYPVTCFCAAPWQVQGTFCADAEEQTLKPSFILILLPHSTFCPSCCCYTVTAAISKRGKIKKNAAWFLILSVCLFGFVNESSETDLIWVLLTNYSYMK